MQAALGQTPSAEELFAFSHETLAPHNKTLRFWEFVEQFPRTLSARSLDALRYYWHTLAQEGEFAMPTLYTRTFHFKESLSDEQVLKEWQFIMEEVTPALLKVSGVRSVKFYSGAGALRADLSVLAEMDDASTYERLLVDAEVRKLLGRLYGAWDLTTAGQSFHREVTPELIRALSSTG